MEGCIAPSEVPGVTDDERTKFGKIAEDLIYMNFVATHGCSLFDLYVDDNNLSSYYYFLKTRNPSLNLYNFSAGLLSSELGQVRPDILVHSPTEKALYEIKPNSQAGRRAGIEKVGKLSAAYIKFHLPYTLGMFYSPSEIVVASFVSQVTITLKSELIGPGLIAYQLCLQSNALLDLLSLSALLRYVIKKMNEQAGAKTFRPIDLKPAFAAEGELAALAKTLGLVFATTAVAVGWSFFWKAVVKRFAVRGATAAFLAAADGPLPVGDLLAAGLAIWTVIDVIRLSNELWADAAVIANQTT